MTAIYVVTVLLLIVGTPLLMVAGQRYYETHPTESQPQGPPLDEFDYLSARIDLSLAGDDVIALFEWEAKHNFKPSQP